MSNPVFLTGALLAFVNGALSYYFYGVYRGWHSSDQIWIPVYCRMDLKSCTSIVDTTYGRLLKIPNALIGIFIMPAFGIIILLVGINVIPLIGALVLGIIVILVGMYLIYGLIKLKTLCPLCLTVHLINLIILILLFSMR